MSDKEFCDEYIAAFDANPTDNLGRLFDLLVVAAAIFSPFLISSFILAILGDVYDEVVLLCLWDLVLIISCFLYPPIHKYVRKRNFLKKVGLNEKQAKRRYEFIKYKKLYMPLVQRMCRLNLRPILKQLDMLKSSFRSTSGVLSEFVFEREYTDEDYENSIGQIKYKSIEERDTIMEILFQIAILEDGIHDDEWELLMSIIKNIYTTYTSQLSMNVKIDTFINKYSKFRSSFADDAKDEKTEESQRRLVPPHLKPYYAILGVEDDATDKDIQQAYHNLALQYHPDLLKNADRIKDCEAKMMKINEAYEKIRG